MSGSTLRLAGVVDSGLDLTDVDSIQLLQNLFVSEGGTSNNLDSAVVSVVGAETYTSSDNQFLSDSRS